MGRAILARGMGLDSDHDKSARCAKSKGSKHHDQK